MKTGKQESCVPTFPGITGPGLRRDMAEVGESQGDRALRAVLSTEEA